MRDVVKISAQGRITIPQAMRDKLKLEVGDYVKVKMNGESLLIIPVNMVEARAKSG